MMLVGSSSLFQGQLRPVWIPTLVRISWLPGSARHLVRLVGLFFIRLRCCPHSIDCSSNGNTQKLPLLFPLESAVCVRRRLLAPASLFPQSLQVCSTQSPLANTSNRKFWFSYSQTAAVIKVLISIFFPLISSGHSESQVLFQVFKGRRVHSPRSLPKFILYLKDFRLQTSMDVSTVDWNSKSRFNKDKVKGRLGKWDLQWGESDFHQVCKSRCSCLDRGENSVGRNSQVCVCVGGGRAEG